VDCNKGPDSDKTAFAALVRELRQAFDPKGLLLSAAVSPSKTVIDAGQCDHNHMNTFIALSNDGCCLAFNTFW
jgi:hypothetical protein